MVAVVPPRASVMGAYEKNSAWFKCFDKKRIQIITRELSLTATTRLWKHDLQVTIVSGKQQSYVDIQ